MLTSDNLAQAFAEKADDERLVKNLGDIYKESQRSQDDLATALQTISDKRNEENNLLAIKSLQEKQLTGSVNEQSTLLKATKGKETAYQASLKSSQAEVAAIKSRMYQLLEVSAQINFGQAVAIAQWASAQTGVRAAFGNDWLRIGGLKGFADGSLGSTTALFFEPYSDAPNTRGLLFDQMVYVFA